MIIFHFTKYDRNGFLDYCYCHTCNYTDCVNESFTLLLQRSQKKIDFNFDKLFCDSRDKSYHPMQAI